MEHRFEEFNGGALSGGCYRRGTEEVQTGSLDMRRNQRGWPQAPVELDQDWQLGSKIQSQQALRNWKHTKFVLLPQSIYAKKKKKKPTKRLINILLSCVQIFAIPWTVACQALLSMDFPGKNTGVGCHSLLQGIFPTQDWTWVSCTGGRILCHWATGEAHKRTLFSAVSLCSYFPSVLSYKKSIFLSSGKGKATDEEDTKHLAIQKRRGGILERWMFASNHLKED